MNKFTTSIVRLDYDEPVSLTDVMRISDADPLLKDFAGVCGITHGMANPPDQYGIRLRVGKHVLPKGAVDIELAVGLDVQVCASSNTLTVYYEGEESLPRFDLSREPDDVAADMVMYAGILETIVKKMEIL